MTADVIIPTGTANLASVLAAFRRLGAELDPVERGSTLAAARRVILPGVGTFGAAMERLQNVGLVQALRERIESDLPTLAICVGMQVLTSRSEESPDAVGLGLVQDWVTRFDTELIVPQLAWGKVTPGPGSRFVEPGWAYFANSYRLARTPIGWSASTATYGEPFVAAMERGNVLACQFHPELSGEWGARVLSRWLDGTSRP